MDRHLLAGVALALFALFLLRGVFLTPGVISFDDLIPFFHVHQIGDFMAGLWNHYYQWPEARAKYSLLGIPLRYGPVIPAALFAVCLLAGLGAYVLTAYLQRFTRWQSRLEWVGPIAAGLVFMLFLFVSKAQQLYSLFLGAALLPWLLFTFVKALGVWQAEERPGLWAVLTALLLVINPAIHMVIIGHAAITLLALGAVFMGKWRAAMIAWGTVTLLGLVPYGLLLWSSGPGLVTAATASAPPSLLRAWSAPFLERLLLPVGLSLPETQASGAYVLGTDLFDRYPMGMNALFALYPLLAAGALVLLRRHVLLIVFGFLWLGATFMATGVQYPYSGYQLFLSVAGSTNPLGALAGAVLSILRNPDRWLLLGALALAVMAALGLTALLARVPAQQPRTQIALGVLTLAVMLLPFGVHPAFRPVFSGDLGGVLRPMPLPQAYSEALALVDKQKTLYLPLMGARPLSWNLSKKTQDEMFALLHGGPSMEGATGSPLLNQLYLGYAYFELLYRGKTTRIGKYLSLVGVRYIFFHDDVEDPLLPDEFTRVRLALESQEDLRLIYQRYDVWLFENLSWRSAAPEPLAGIIAFDGGLDRLDDLLVAGIDPKHVGLLHVGEGDLNWTTFTDWAKRLGPRLIVYAPAGEEDFLLSLLSRSVGAVFFPKLGWDEEASQQRDQRWLNISVTNFLTFSREYGLFGVEGAQGYQLVAATDEDAIAQFQLAIPQAGVYTVFVRAYAPQGARLHLDLDDLYESELILKPGSFYRFTHVDQLFLRSGVHKLTLRTRSNVPVSINLIYAIPESTLADYEQAFAQWKSSMVQAASSDEVASLVQALPEPDNSSISFYGYYGERFWDQRWLVSQRESARPWRSWLVGSLYSLSAPSPTEELRFIVGQAGRP